MFFIFGIFIVIAFNADLELHQFIGHGMYDQFIFKAGAKLSHNSNTNNIIQDQLDPKRLLLCV